MFNPEFEHYFERGYRRSRAPLRPRRTRSLSPNNSHHVQSSSPGIELYRPRKTNTGTAARNGSFDEYYPHIFNLIIQLAPLEARLALRLVSRNARQRVDYYFPPHVLLRHNSNGSLSITRPDPGASPSPVSAPRTYFGMAGDEVFPDPEAVSNTTSTVFRFLYNLARDDAATTLSMARVLDLDLGGLVMLHAQVEELRDLMPGLQVVRHHNCLDLYAALIPANVLVYFPPLPEMWLPCFPTHPTATAIEKIVLNVDGSDVHDLPTFDNWAHLGPHHETRLNLIEHERPLPAEIVFFVSFYGLPKDLFAYLVGLWRRITAQLLKTHPWVKPTFVVRPVEAEGSSTTTTYRPAPGQAQRSRGWLVQGDTNAHENVNVNANQDISEITAAWHPNTPHDLRKLKDALVAIFRQVTATPTPLFGGNTSYAWEADETEAMVSRFEVITSTEYRARIGPDAFRLETGISLPLAAA